MVGTLPPGVLVAVAAVLHFAGCMLFAAIFGSISCFPDASCVWQGLAILMFGVMVFPAILFLPTPLVVMCLPVNSVLFGLGVAWFVHRRRLQRSGVTATDGVCDEMAGTAATLRALILIALLLCLCLVPLARVASLKLAGMFVLLFCIARLWIVRIARTRGLDARWCRRALVVVAGVVFASFILLVLVPYPPAMPSEADRARELSYAETVKAVRRMVAGRRVPLHLRFLGAVRWRTDFDVNRYFSLLTRIGPEPGYALDYVYEGFSFGFSGVPTLYGRKKWAPPYLTSGGLFPRNDIDECQPARDGSILRVRSDDSPDGYVQLLILYIEGPRFYRSAVKAWETRIVADRDEMERLLDSPHGRPVDTEVADAIKRAGPEPVVVVGESSVSVSLLTSRGTDGLERTTCEITRAMPHRIKETRRETVKQNSDPPVLY